MQIADNARQWARDRSDLELKLREAEYGLTASQNSEKFRTYPKIVSVSSFAYV